MPRYITKQRHSASCGPVAVINILKWLGRHATYDSHLKKFLKLGWDVKDGMQFNKFSKSLKHFKIKYKRHIQPSMREVIQMLDRGHAIVVLYKWFYRGRSGAHYAAIFGYDDIHFSAKNAECAKYRFILGEFFRSAKRHSHIYPVVWEIKKS